MFNLKKFIENFKNKKITNSDLCDLWPTPESSKILASDITMCHDNKICIAKNETCPNYEKCLKLMDKTGLNIAGLINTYEEIRRLQNDNDRI